MVKVLPVPAEASIRLPRRGGARSDRGHGGCSWVQLQPGQGFWVGLTGGE